MVELKTLKVSRGRRPKIHNSGPSSDSTKLCETRVKVEV